MLLWGIVDQVAYKSVAIAKKIEAVMLVEASAATKVPLFST